MPPALAALVTISLIFGLFLRDSRYWEKKSPALWLPVLWIVIAGTRFVSQWIDLTKGAGISSGTLHEGSPVDALYFATLIMGGIFVLVSRQVSFTEVFRYNQWLILFFAYCLLAVIWSDFPFIAIKRYIKILGHPIMALVILTDPNPKQAFRVVMRRCAYIMMPLSVLFIKYYPHIGRGYDGWTGEVFHNGAMLTKNELGAACLLFGLFFFWSLLTSLRIEDRRLKRDELILNFVFLLIILWLLQMSKSATSQACLIIGVVAISSLGLNSIRQRFTATVVIVLFLGILAELTLDFHAVTVAMLGRDPTLTDRTEVWVDALALVENPLTGAGFESFWLGQRLQLLWEKWWWRPNQAHNGYIETYLNLGLIGLGLLIATILDTFRKASRQLMADFECARLRLGFLFVILVYNYTEATFKGVHIVWTVFHIIALQYPNTMAALSVLRNNRRPSSSVR